MRKLILLVVVAALLYSGYWFVARGQIQTRMIDTLADLENAPVSVAYGSLKTSGFPSRFDTTLTDLVIEDVDAGLRLDAPIFQLLALSYAPNNVRAVFAPEQRITLGEKVYTLFTEEMAARAMVSPNGALTFQQAELELINPRLRDTAGSELAMARLFAAMRLAPETTQSYDVFSEARSIVLPEDIRRLIDPGGLQPPIIQSLRLDAQAELSAALALNSPDTEPPEVTGLSIKEFSFAWGDMSLTAIGDLAPDSGGVLNGSVTVSARNWQSALDLAIANGAVSDDRRFLFTEIANNLDETPHITDTLTVTLSITDGFMALGGFQLGAAPVMR